MMRTGLVLLLALGAFGILGCGDDDSDPPRDSGPGDTGPGTDSGPGPDDGGPPTDDAGPPDAGPECTVDEDCPDPASECQTVSCTGGMCTTTNVALGTPTAV